MVIINMTQHKSTKDQRKQEVIDLPEILRKDLVSLLTFNEMPSKEEIENRANSIKELALKAIKIINAEGKEVAFMVGGAPYLMPSLVQELKKIGKVLFAFSKRVTEETTLPDGSVEKKMIFKHEGFIEI